MARQIQEMEDGLENMSIYDTNGITAGKTDLILDFTFHVVNMLYYCLLLLQFSLLILQNALLNLPLCCYIYIFISVFKQNGIVNSNNPLIIM